MQAYEQLGSFYLGRTYDVDERRVKPETLLYDSKDLCTHAVCVGMTGSGKTGLCLSLLEEAALDGIPTIAIDPKGDLGNLKLQFPDLQPADFEPWVDPGEATRRGMTTEEFAKATAATWEKGLADWDQDGDRIARLQAAADVAVYTPGSKTGIPLTVLRSFAAPSAALRADEELFRQRVGSAASGLLALMGVVGDTLQSREHILVARILEEAWSAGRNLDVPTLLREIQSPPFDRVGFLDLESFFPSGERFELAMRLNNLLASPAFASWLEGEPLDVGRLLRSPDGKPKVSVLSISHLSDSERMFFVTILLEEVLAWMRTQAGTSSLRAILYMDEIFGYFPPTANPPSKRPMLTLLKQARAYGLGCVLATQNPVDLDYKGLSNCGTWFLGRLQTERDKLRVLDGLETAATGTGTGLDRKRLEGILSNLGSRVFLMNNVHEDHPEVFHTRWAMSYLRGPLSREQIRSLTPDRPASSAAPGSLAAAAAEREAVQPAPVAAAPTSSASVTSGRPVAPPEIDEGFLAASSRGTGRLVYRPGLFAKAKLHFVRSTWDLDAWRTARVLVTATENDDVWSEADVVLGDEDADVDPQPVNGAEFAGLPSGWADPSRYKKWRTALKDHLYQTQRVTLKKSSKPKVISSIDETEADFQARLSQAARELRDLEVEKLKSSLATKVDRLKERIRKAEQRVDREKAQANQSALSAALHFGSTVLGAMFGRKTMSATTVSRSATSMRSAGRAAEQRADIGRAQQDVKALEEDLQELEAEFEEKSAAVREKFTVDNIELDTLDVRPRKSDVDVENVMLLWTPWYVDATGIATPAFDA